MASTTGNWESRLASVEGVLAVAVGSGSTLSLVVLFRALGLTVPPFGVPTAVLCLCVVTVLQLYRLADATDRNRRIGIVGTTVGLGAIVLGLNPVSACPETVRSCLVTFEYNAFLPVGFVLTVAMVYVDLRGRTD